MVPAVHISILPTSPVMFKFRDIILLFMVLVYSNSLKFIPKAVRQDPAAQLNLSVNFERKKEKNRSDIK